MDDDDVDGDDAAELGGGGGGVRVQRGHQPPARAPPPVQLAANQLPLNGMIAGVEYRVSLSFSMPSLFTETL